ncbi:hypothetical protein I0D00_01015 [Pseudomonas lalucatii]|uniref:Prophage PssSM-01 n=1 Tax=Pseudomonas lalucatii TaxID=1424203 RepID=A0ABS5PVG5_9PSED|nr:YmfL family putative regulatory protein [Pseudomonas lalucatii]MBS7660531.1 hypothetical protein [Pseudomonas lalucatii]MBS7724604.1 hypothetical protein [Pseudomonas lalucatii]QVM87402.1 hypothetical protein I0D68_19955 [Pseudomonas lalucatii]
MKRTILETRRQVMSAVVSAYPGGRECAASRLGLSTVKKLDNHVYENAGSQPLTDEQIHTLEQQAGTTHLPDYICALYGGVYVPMPEQQALDNLDLYARGMDTAIKRGKVDAIIAAALVDGEITETEIAEIIAAHRQHIAARHAEVGAVITLHRRHIKENAQ